MTPLDEQDVLLSPPAELKMPKPHSQRKQQEKKSRQSIQLEYTSASQNESSEEDTPSRGAGATKVTKAIYDKLSIVKEEEMN